MMTDEIMVGRLYAKVGVLKPREVLAIKNGVVEYTVAGLMTFAPMKMSIKEFSDWADHVVEWPSRH
ncbi:hypothetical protein HFN01_33780 [Rhizobium leguminosarum]|uniref:hypothetical protein n=1 Tax=Rhizobium leguminosarum TaxID=384 RepID=UPI001C93C78F|nr:hypothetical protein [Rhizobium leguminosarum]MBY5399766.1 hypothetical protein [Rhizobium leguminosarum]